MKVGDLVKIKDTAILSPKDPRCTGTIIKFDVYGNTDRHDRHSFSNEPIVEVMWATGQIKWILQKRLELVSES